MFNKKKREEIKIKNKKKRSANLFIYNKFYKNYKLIKIPNIYK